MEGREALFVLMVDVFVVICFDEVFNDLSLSKFAGNLQRIIAFNIFLILDDVLIMFDHWHSIWLELLILFA